MWGSFRWCRWALSVAFLQLGGSSTVVVAELPTIGFPGGVMSRGFVTAGGSKVVTLGGPGVDLSGGVVRDSPVRTTVVASDPVSRVVVFQAAGAGDPLELASSAPVGGKLSVAVDGAEVRILGRVERVGGKFLPFTLIQVRYTGVAPERGTPLLDADGRVAAVAHEVIGEGVGYAVPVEVVRRVLDDSSHRGRVERAWLGLTLLPQNGLPKVMRTVADSPAAKAGIRGGDLLVEVGGRRVSDYGDAVNAFFLLRPGVPATVKIRRGGGEQVLQVVPQIAAK